MNAWEPESSSTRMTAPATKPGNVPATSKPSSPLVVAMLAREPQEPARGRRDVEHQVRGCHREAGDVQDAQLGRVAVRPPEFASGAVRCDGVHEVDRPAGELSYWLIPQARGRGLAYAAVRLMMASVVAGTGLRSVVLDIEAGNVASERLAERLGAERRDPTRVEVDQTGIPRTLVIYVLPVEPA
jgi:Acetyltransferase (GNAT) domain